MIQDQIEVTSKKVLKSIVVYAVVVVCAVPVLLWAAKIVGAGQ